MIEGLKPYAESAKMKPMTCTSVINIPWLTAIPEHWKIVRAKGIFSARTERARPDDEQLSATQAYGVIPQKEFERRVGRKVVQIMQHLDKRAHVEPDDFVISMRSFQGGLERAWARGCIRSSYVVLKPSPETQVGYFAHLFKSLDYIRALQATGNFIRDGQDLNFNNFSLVDLPLPPLDEQADIAKCLDHANRKIDRFIRAKRKLIGLLNEQKQAIIHHAVTRGLDPDTPLKPSGIPWLGDIPKHWEVRPIKHWAKINARTLGEATEANFEFRYIDIGAVRTGCLVAEPEVMRFDKAPSRARRVLVAGDTIVSTVRTYLKTVWFVGENPVNLVASTGFAVFSPLAAVEPEYLSYVLQDSGFVNQVTASSVGIAYPAIAESVLARLRIAIPPCKSEQDGIIVAIKSQTYPLNTAIARTEREIALMQEYRTRLTADIVTGKLDVREAAAKLPDLPTDPAAELFTDEALDDSETEDAEA